MTAPAPEITLREDTMIWPAMESLVECLCAEVAASGLPPVCICTVLPGLDVAVDYVTPEAGMAWVRLNNFYPYSRFPAQDSGGQGCLSPMAAELEIGVLYCAPVADGLRGTRPPTAASQTGAAQIQMAAMAAMLRAIQCCLGAHPKAVSLGSYTPVGPAGAVVGGTWSVFVAEGAVR